MAFGLKSFHTSTTGGNELVYVLVSAPNFVWGGQMGSCFRKAIISARGATFLTAFLTTFLLSFSLKFTSPVQGKETNSKRFSELIRN